MTVKEFVQNILNEDYDGSARIKIAVPGHDAKFYELDIQTLAQDGTQAFVLSESPDAHTLETTRDYLSAETEYIGEETDIPIFVSIPSRMFNRDVWHTFDISEEEIDLEFSRGNIIFDLFHD